MLEYLLKSREITILDMMIVAVAASIIAPVTMYIAAWILKRIWNFIYAQYQKVKESYKRKKRLDNGRISMNELIELREKDKEGTLTKREEKALRIAEEKMTEGSKKLAAHVKKHHPNLPTLEDFERFRNGRDK